MSGEVFGRMCNSPKLIVGKYISVMASLLSLLLMLPPSLAQVPKTKQSPQAEVRRVLIQVLVFSTLNDDAGRLGFDSESAKSIWPTEEFQAHLWSLEKQGLVKSKHKGLAIVWVGRKFTLPTNVPPFSVIPNIGLIGQIDPNNFLEGRVRQLNVGRDVLYQTDINLVISFYGSASDSYSEIQRKDTLCTKLGETALIGNLSDGQSQAKHQAVFAVVTVYPLGSAESTLLQ